MIPISIKKDGIEILLDIIRPLKRTDRILRGCVLDINQSIPKKLASQYKIRQFDESGVYIYKDKTCSQKYSNKRIQFEKNRYVIDRGKDASIERALAFVFWNDSGEINPLTIDSSDIYCQGKYIKHYYLTGVPKNKRGYIIQSLEKQKTELTYYEPFPVGFNTRNDKLNFNERITAINRLQTCIKYGLYIEDFLAPKEINSGLFREYVDLCKKYDNDINFDILWEGALNLNTNWLLIPRTEWQKEIDEGLDPKLVDDLLERYSLFIPDVYDKLTEYLKRFWRYQWTGRITRQSSPERKFVKYIMTGEGETPSQMPGFSRILREMK